MRPVRGISVYAVRSHVSAVQSQESGMRKWVKPRIVEIAIGMEINSYACAKIE
jgi:coenzyme PQQ precursor peptide PqqA